MEKYIEEVVNEDKKAREKVEHAKRLLMEASNEVSLKSQSIYQQFMDDEKNQMNLIQQQINDEVALVKKQCEEEKELGLKKLSELYDKHKDEWIKQIVDNVLSQRGNYDGKQ